jgi:hypothetical protein
MGLQKWFLSAIGIFVPSVENKQVYDDFKCNNIFWDVTFIVHVNFS